jgi:hypothetical protein
MSLLLPIESLRVFQATAAMSGCSLISSLVVLAMVWRARRRLQDRFPLIMHCVTVSEHSALLLPVFAPLFLSPDCGLSPRASHCDIAILSLRAPICVCAIACMYVCCASFSLLAGVRYPQLQLLLVVRE